MRVQAILPGAHLMSHPPWGGGGRQSSAVLSPLQKETLLERLKVQSTEPNHDAVRGVYTGSSSILEYTEWLAMAATADRAA